MDILEIQTRVIKIAAEQLGKRIEDISPDDNFAEDLEADSLDIVEMVMAFEDEFNIELDDNDIDKIVIVKNAVDHIKSVIDAK
jgi:acyl carrier protein